jgi:hypothetical protein
VREETFSWMCPFCNQPATITNYSTSSDDHQFNRDNKQGNLVLRTEIVVCPNPRCREYKIVAGLYKHTYTGSTWTISKDAIEEWLLRPRSLSKPFPAYIPQAILDDYREACLIVSDSPKASATLSRRCLQGIIRDFWKTSKPRLIDEIKGLEGMIDVSEASAILGLTWRRTSI